MKPIKEAIGLLALGMMLGAIFLAARPLAEARLHWGAPPLAYSCQPGQQVKRWWVPDSSPEGRGAPGTLEWHGWREIASCTDSVGVSLP